MWPSYVRQILWNSVSLKVCAATRHLNSSRVEQGTSGKVDRVFLQSTQGTGVYQDFCCRIWKSKCFTFVSCSRWIPLSPLSAIFTSFMAEHAAYFRVYESNICSWANPTPASAAIPVSMLRDFSQCHSPIFKIFNISNKFNMFKSSKTFKTFEIPKEFKMFKIFKIFRTFKIVKGLRIFIISRMFLIIKTAEFPRFQIFYLWKILRFKRTSLKTLN